jgi:REP element-mobilizing transposase RayT
MKSNQLGLNLFKGQHGGRRPHSGRKRVHSKGVAHRTREKVSGRTPLHINFKFRTRIKNKQSLRILKRAMEKAAMHGLRIIHFSMQSNHMHFIMEAPNNEILTRGMRALTISFAKGLKQGRIQVERYHLHVLRTVREAKNAISYVLFNKQKHEKGTYSVIDGYSSLIHMKHAFKIISRFAKTSKVTLKFTKGEVWGRTDAESYLARKALAALAD